MKTGNMWRTAFGPGFAGHEADVFADELINFSATRRAQAFKARMDRYFVEQVGRFAPPNEPAPFPLAVMTCVGIETIASYKFGDSGHWAGIKKPKPGSTQHFQKFLELMDPELSEMAEDPEGQKKSLSTFIFEGFRHSIVHGFYGRWVFITDQEKEASSWIYDAEYKCVVVNVYWIYRRFLEVYEDYFQQLLVCDDVTEEPLKTFSQTFELKFSLWLQKRAIANANVT